MEARRDSRARTFLNSRQWAEAGKDKPDTRKPRQIYRRRIHREVASTSLAYVKKLDRPKAKRKS